MARKMKIGLARTVFLIVHVAFAWPQARSQLKQGGLTRATPPPLWQRCGARTALLAFSCQDQPLVNGPGFAGPGIQQYCLGWTNSVPRPRSFSIVPLKDVLDFGYSPYLCWASRSSSRQVWKVRCLSFLLPSIIVLLCLKYLQFPAPWPRLDYARTEDISQLTPLFLNIFTSTNHQHPPSKDSIPLPPSSPSSASSPSSVSAFSQMGHLLHFLSSHHSSSPGASLSFPQLLVLATFMQKLCTNGQSINEKNNQFWTRYKAWPAPASSSSQRQQHIGIVCQQLLTEKRPEDSNPPEISLRHLSPLVLSKLQLYNACLPGSSPPLTSLTRAKFLPK